MGTIWAKKLLRPVLRGLKTRIWLIIKNQTLKDKIQTQILTLLLQIGQIASCHFHFFSCFQDNILSSTIPVCFPYEVSSLFTQPKLIKPQTCTQKKNNHLSATSFDIKKNPFKLKNPIKCFNFLQMGFQLNFVIIITVALYFILRFATAACSNGQSQVSFVFLLSLFQDEKLIVMNLSQFYKFFLMLRVG